MNDPITDVRTRIDALEPADACVGVQNGDALLDVREPAKLESGDAIENAVPTPRGLPAALTADSLHPMGYDTTVIEADLEGWKTAGLSLRG